MRTRGGDIAANRFFSIVDTCFSYEDIAQQSYDGAQMAIVWVLHFQRAARSTFHTCIINLHKGHTMRRSTVDIQSTAAEIRRGKERR